MNRVVEIFKAWGIAFNPNDEQAKLASQRLQICDKCEFKRDKPVIHCSVCGCALKAKIYTPVKGACPKGFWDAVDGKNIDIKAQYNGLKK
jgi:hypothetical protein